MLDRLPDIAPDIHDLITEDDTPVDNLPSEKQQRLLTEPLYSSWPGPGENRPFLVLEIVSNTVGGEDTEKRRKYARMRVPSYVIYDPQLQVMAEVLTIYRLRESQYERQDTVQFPGLKLGLILWAGEFEGKEDTWLRWTDEQGVLIPTGKERAEQADQRAEQADQRAEQERHRAERLAVLLRQAGIDPEQR